MQIVIDHLIGKVEPLRGKSNDQGGLSINHPHGPKGVAQPPPSGRNVGGEPPP